MKKVCIISYTDLAKDPRPRHHINWLKENYEVTSIGVSPGKHPEVEFLELKKTNFLVNALRIVLLLKFKLYQTYYWDRHKKNLLEQLLGRSFDVIIVHEVRLLPLALRFANGAKIILDAHEYSPENFTDNFYWKFFIKKYYTYLCNEYLEKVDWVTTVSEGIAELYKKNFDVNVSVVRSAADYFELEPSPVQQDKIRLLYHGICSASRKSELMIEAMQHLEERFELSIMLVVSKSTRPYFNKLKSLAADSDRVKFLEPVKSDELVEFSNQFDAILIFWPPVNKNLQNALPNKFFRKHSIKTCCDHRAI